MFGELEQQLLLLIQTIFDAVGWAGVAGLLVIEGATGLMPGEIILALAGWMLIAAHEEPFVFVFLGALAAALGSMAGSSVTYWFARIGGAYMVVRIIQWLRIDSRHLARTEALFEKHGGGLAFFGRLIPSVRTFIAIPAGVAKMSFPKFAFYSFLGAYIWCVLVISFGFFMGHEWWRIREVGGSIVPWLAAALVVAGSLYLAWRMVRRSRFA